MAPEQLAGREVTARSDISVTFYTFMVREAIPLTIDMSRPYAGLGGPADARITLVAAYGFYASRGDEELFGACCSTETSAVRPRYVACSDTRLRATL